MIIVAILEVENVSKAYETPAHRVQALDAVSLCVEPGQFVAVQGASGCGKSTLLLIAGGLLSPDSGRVKIEGQNPYELSANARAQFRAAKIGFVFQQFHLVPYLSVMDNVLAASIVTQLPDARARARELLQRFGLEHRSDHVPGELSIGERQRTALARALLNRPKLLLADEPTGNLDRENAEIVLTHLVEFARDGAVLLVTHDTLALEYAQRVERIQNGRIVASE